MDSRILNLEDALDAMQAHECAALARELSLIAELDRREAYRVDGAASMTDWVSFKYGWSESKPFRDESLVPPSRIINDDIVSGSSDP